MSTDSRQSTQQDQEPLEAVSREVGVEVYRLEQWRDKALAGMDEALKERGGDPLQGELNEAKRCIGESSMECELLRRGQETRRPFPRKKRPK